jgi:peptidyl-prolyl cis-trans isomerase C
MRKLLIVATCALLAACGDGDDAVPKKHGEVLQFNAGAPGMVIDGQGISKELLAAVARGRGWDLRNPQQHEKAVREMLDYVLLAQAARRDAADTDTQFSADVEVSRLQGVANGMLVLYARRHPISDEQMKAEYDDQTAKAGTLTYDFSQLLFTKEADAIAAEADIAAGKPFASVFDTWRGKAQQAKTYKAVKLPQLPAPELVETLKAMKVGEATKTPVKTQFGYHLIGLTATTPYTPPAFDQIKDEIRSLLVARQNEAYLAKLRAQSAVQNVDEPPAPGH